MSNTSAKQNKNKPHIPSETTQDCFKYRFTQGEIVLPFLQHVKLKHLEQAATATTNEEYNLLLLDALLDETGKKLLRELTVSEFNDLCESWQKDSELNVKNS